MRVFKDYRDYKENKNENENGVTQDFLDTYYDGNINKAQEDNINNINCFNCFNCYKCNNCDYCDYCDYCDNCIHCENCNDRSRLYATFNSQINNKDNQL